MVTRVTLGGAVALILLLSGASAQESGPAEPSMLEVQREAKPRPIVRPGVDGGQAGRDAASATADSEQRQRDETLMREQTRPALRRPDLGYDVTSGIQQRNLRR